MKEQKTRKLTLMKQTVTKKKQNKKRLMTKMMTKMTTKMRTWKVRK